jgi:oligopeptide/dipeptide ABC transporter ATP-binding protein
LNSDIILSIDDLHTCFKVGKKDLTAVNGVSFDVARGKTLGIVGESGCGKSVTAHSVLQLLPKLGRVYAGKVTYRKEDGEELVLNSYKKNGKEMRAIRGQEISMIFQDPMMCLNPVYNIGDQIIEGLLEHTKMSKKEALVKAAEMLTTLGIPKAEDRLRDYPHQFSGGMKQRVMIAIAMINNPKLLIADEPTTALDVTIQAQILELMQQVQELYGTTIILITHNMGIVADMADNIAVMYMGRIVEFGTASQVFLESAHPYTRALLMSVPVLGIGERKRLEPIRGSTPDPANMPEGCEFSPRCDFATEQCKVAPPDTLVSDGHRVRCWNCKAGCSNEQ